MCAAGLHSEQLALLDLLILARAQRFVGFAASTFSYYLREHRALAHGLPKATSVLVGAGRLGTDPLFEQAGTLAEDPAGDPGLGPGAWEQGAGALPPGLLLQEEAEAEPAGQPVRRSLPPGGLMVARDEAAVRRRGAPAQGGPRQPVPVSQS